MNKINVLWLLVFSLTSLVCSESFAEQAINQKSAVKPSKFSIDETAFISKEVFAELTDEFFLGKTKALKIFFSSERLTDEAKLDLLNNNGNSIKVKASSYLVLFIDKDNHIWQVNITIIIPGQTAFYTVAWKPEELKQFSSSYFYDGKRLTLKNKGSFKDVNSTNVATNITWDVNVDIPVVDKIGSKKGI